MHPRALLFLLFLATPTGPTGSLEIRTLPGTEVVWEGVSLGETDTGGSLLIEGIIAGEYSIVLRKEGHREAATRADISPGEESVLLLLLEEVPATAPVAAARREERRQAGSSTGSESGPKAESDPARRTGSSSPDSRKAPGRPSAAGVRREPTPAVAAALLMAVALFSGALILAIRRYRAARRPARAVRYRHPPLEGRRSADERIRDRPAAAFLDDFKRREQALEHLPDEDVIEVEFSEVIPPVEDER